MLLYAVHGFPWTSGRRLRLHHMMILVVCSGQADVSVHRYVCTVCVHTYSMTVSMHAGVQVSMCVCVYVVKHGQLAAVCTECNCNCNIMDGQGK